MGEEDEEKKNEDKEEESQAEKGIFKLKRDLKAEKEKDETNKEKAADTFVNDIYTMEGKQESIETIGEIKDDDENKVDAKAPDSFVNDIYTSEGKQAPGDAVSKEREEKAADSF